jgi:hypothetical protein
VETAEILKQQVFGREEESLEDQNRRIKVEFEEYKRSTEQIIQELKNQIEEMKRSSKGN